MHIPTKKYKRKNAKKICLMGQIVIEILTEPLDPRDPDKSCTLD